MATGMLDFVAVREAIAALLEGLGFSTLAYDPVVPVAPYATVNLPDRIEYHVTYENGTAADVIVTLYVGSADEASANRDLDRAISWNIQGAIPMQLEYAARQLAAAGDAPWNTLVVDAATNRRTVDLENTVGPLLAIDLVLRLMA